VRRATRIVLGVAGLLVAWQVVHGARAALSEYRDLRPTRAPVVRPPDARTLGLVDVRFPGRDGTTIAGWYVPSRTGAALVLCTGTGTDRTDLVGRLRRFEGSGIGILLYDSPGFGESGGRVRLGAPERAALSGALDFVAARRDVDPRRIGILAFSQGTVYATTVAAHDPRVRALALEGAFGDFDEQVRAEYSRGGPFSSWGAELGSRLGGIDVQGPRPIDIIASIAPRPIVFVAGTADRTVPLGLSRALYDAARPPKQFWVIPGAAHGSYGTADATYVPRLRAFFDTALAAPRDSAPPVLAATR